MLVTRFIIRLSPREYEWELMPLGIDQIVSALIWSPLGWGRLTGKIRAPALPAGEPLIRPRIWSAS